MGSTNQYISTTRMLPDGAARMEAPPIVADRSSFPNAATFANAVASYGQALPFFEKRTLFRFTIGRTF